MDSTGSEQNTVAGSCKHGDGPQGSVKGWIFLQLLSGCEPTRTPLPGVGASSFTLPQGHSVWCLHATAAQH
jgi:hypothetical protein